MKRRVENWTIEKVNKTRPQISFPEYQRQPNLWSFEKQGLLIDSILRGIDIPKLYFNRTKEKTFEVVDGQQRLWSIWNFFDDEYKITADGRARSFSELSEPECNAIRDYELQITILEDVEDDDLRVLFLRLQLGLLLVTGEKLNALTGEMKDFVFGKLSKNRFIQSLNVPNRRHAKETLSAQICINSFSRSPENTREFSRTRYEGLEHFFKRYEHPQGRELDFFRDQSKKVLCILDDLWGCFKERAASLNSRSYILSIYLLFEEIEDRLASQTDRRKFVEFVLLLWTRLKQEAKAGINRKNPDLYEFETRLSSAPGERYQIERRHQKLIKYYDHFKETRKIVGD